MTKKNNKGKNIILGVVLIVIAISIIYFITIGFTLLTNNTNNKEEIDVISRMDCEALKDVKFFTNEGYFFTNDGVYEYSTSIFSNNKNCQKVSDVVIAKKIANYYVDKNYNFYYIIDNKFMKVGEEVYVDKTYYHWDYLQNDDVVIASNINFKLNDDYKSIYVLKKDGKLYKIDFNFSYNYDIKTKEYTYNSEILKEEVFLEYKNEKIKDFEMLFYDKISYDFVITDKAIYTEAITNLEECTKYNDIECKWELQKNKVLTENVKDIAIIINKQFIKKNGDVIIIN